MSRTLCPPPRPRLFPLVQCNFKLVFVLEQGLRAAWLTVDLGWGRVLLQLDGDDLLDNPGEAQSAFYEGPGVSGPGVLGGPQALGHGSSCPWWWQEGGREVLMVRGTDP